MTHILYLAALLGASLGQDTELEATSFDGFRIEARIAAEGALEDQERVVVLVHGSGAQSMDADLSAVTEGGAPNPFFVDLSQALNAAGFAALRYHKRSYALQARATADPAFARGEEVRAFQAAPLSTLVEDAKACVDLAREACPSAKVYLLGHSQGTYVALQAAREKEVAGVALIGFSTAPMSLLYFEQLVYRSLRQFRRLDGDRDEALDEEELGVEDPFAVGLRSQRPFLDSDGDGRISRIEFQAASLTGVIQSDPFAGAYLREEATYPRIADLLRNAEFEVVFLQGMLDNQTAAYHAKGIELVNKVQWRKDNLHFEYFPGLGHALDPRDDYDDLVYRRADPDALARAGDLLEATFR